MSHNKSNIIKWWTVVDNVIFGVLQTQLSHRERVVVYEVRVGVKAAEVIVKHDGYRAGLHDVIESTSRHKVAVRHEHKPAESVCVCVCVYVCACACASVRTCAREYCGM